MAFQLRPRRHSRNRRKNPNLGMDVAFTAEFTTPNILLTFTDPVVLRTPNIPQYMTDTGKLPTSATQLTPYTVQLVYTTPGSVTEITVPSRDEAIRSTTGGYVGAGTFPTP